jgi:hypothetical protein
MKLVILLFAALFLQSNLMSMEHLDNMQVNEQVEFENRSVKNSVQDIKLDVIQKKLDEITEKMSTLEQRQKTYKYRMYVCISILGSASSTIGLLLYIASWYYQFK